MISQYAGRLRRYFLTDSLFRNSFYLMLNTGLQAVIGFFFWLIAARIFNPTQIGLVTALISAGSLVSVFCLLGFNNVLVRFLPTSQRKNEQLSTVFTLAGIASFFGSFLFLMWGIWSHSPTIPLNNIKIISALFILYVLVLSLNSLIESAFIAYRDAKYVLIKNVIINILKLVLLFFVIELGFIGILGITTAVTLIAFLIGYVWLITKFNYRPSLAVDMETIRETKKFAIGNYLGTLFGVLPSTTLILIIISRLSAQDAAFFYIPSMMATVLNIIPSSTAQSLFAEISNHESEMAKYIKDGVKNLFMALIPAVVIVWITGGFILKFFGPDYASAGVWPLRILALSSIVGALNYFGDTLLLVKKFSGMYIFMNALNSLTIVGLSYYMAPRGLVAIAVSSLIAQIITLAVYFLINWELVAEQWNVRRQHA